MKNTALERRIRQHVLGPEHRFRAICHPGFELTLAQELAAAGIPERHCDHGAVEFQSRFSQVCAAQAMLRTASRVLMRLRDWHAENFGQLEKGLAAIPWELYLPPKCQPEIEVHCHRSRLYHSDAIAMRAMNILAEKRNTEPEESQQSAAQPQKIYLRLDHDHCQVSLDLSGELLYKRGYGRYTEEAPLRETLASSILLAAHFHNYTQLLDPMAGSGVFSIEAAQWAHGRPPGATRSFSCQKQPAYRPAAFAHALRHPFKPFASSTPTQYFCSDRNAKACTTAMKNTQYAEVEAWIQPEEMDFFTIPSPPPSTLLVLNPPYGKRLQADPVSLFREIGRKIRADFSHCACAIICPGASCRQALGISAHRIMKSVNGGIPVEVLFRDA